MNQAIIITDDILNNIVPSDIMPRRLDSATILLVCLKHQDKEGILVFNTSPDIWMTWYPFYDDTNKYVINYEFKSKTYGELIKEYETIFSKNAKDEESRIKCVKELFMSRFNVNKIDVEDSSIANSFYQLRYSKTANLWTLYRIEFFIVKFIDNPLNIMLQNKIQQDILPFTHNSKELFNNMPITESLWLILNNKDLVEKLRNYIIEL
jgi:uncharacterized protein YhbP (UPF0306 family)